MAKLAEDQSSDSDDSEEENTENKQAKEETDSEDSYEVNIADQHKVQADGSISPLLHPIENAPNEKVQVN